MNEGNAPVRESTGGFSLVELLVVLLILGILVSIASPTLIATAPERNLAAAGDRFANDINYARAKAEATGNNVYLGFKFRPDDLQIEPYYEEYTDSGGIIGLPIPVPRLPLTTGDGTSFNVPPNPGVSRISTEYYIVEERPRWNADGSAYTYLDWLDDLDAYDPSDNDPPYPVEPLFPFDALETVASGLLPDPARGPFNRIAAPLVNHTLDLNDVSSSNSYDPLHIINRPLNGDWSDGHPLDQARKIFCIADEAEIVSLDRNIIPNELRTYDPTGNTPDHARLEDQVVDYVLLKRVELPEHVYFINPWKDQWVVGYDSQGQYMQQLQFLQYLWQIQPSGQIAQAEWTYDPEPFPNGEFDNLVHGTVNVIDSVPTVRPFWMVIEECIDFSANVQAIGTDNPGSSAMLANNKKCNLASSGRMFTLWSLNAKYYVDDYTPNDSSRGLAMDDARLNMDRTVNPSSLETGDDEYVLEDKRTSTEYSSYVAREFGYAQNFLYPPAY